MRRIFGECEPITWVWGGAPAWPRGRASDQGGYAPTPPEAESFSALECPKEAAFLPVLEVLRI